VIPELPHGMWPPAQPKEDRVDFKPVIEVKPDDLP
jgi:hypothetical protein